MSGFTLANTIAGLLTIGIISFLYKDNPFYKLCESIFIGVSAGYWFVSLYYQNMVPKLLDNLGIMKLLYPSDPQMINGALQKLIKEHSLKDERWIFLIAGILGIMMLMRLLPKIGWISRWPLAFVVGYTAGLYFILYLQSNAIEQMYKSIIPLVVIDPTRGFNLTTTINNIVIVGGTLTALIYFFFSKEHKGFFGGSARVGIWVLMVTFGAAFGYTVMSRMSLLIGRLDFLFGTWLGLIK